MSNFRLDVSRETGAATLWMATSETACGFKPVLAWPNMDGVRDFAYILLNIDHYRRGADIDTDGGKRTPRGNPDPDIRQHRDSE
jgi:hypothetical protein